MNVRNASIRKLEAGNMTTAEGHELLRKRRHSKLQSINGMEAKSIIVASAPSFHELQCMYWHGSRTCLVLLPIQGLREV